MIEDSNISVKIDARLIEAADGLLEHLGISGFSSKSLGVLGSWIEPLHRDNVVQWVRKVIERCASRSYTNERLIPWILLAPAVRAAAEEDDPVMLDLQAKLVSGFRNRDWESMPNKAFIQLLAGMRPIDFGVLKHALSPQTLIAAQLTYSAKAGSHPPWIPNKASVTPDEIATALSATASQVVLASENLVRLGCFRSVTVPGRFVGVSHLPTNPAGCQIWHGETKYVPSDLGIALLTSMDEPAASSAS